MSSKLWSSVDGSILKSLPNAAKGYEQRISVPEFTFLGVKNQPDFGDIGPMGLQVPRRDAQTGGNFRDRLHLPPASHTPFFDFSFEKPPP